MTPQQRSTGTQSKILAWDELLDTRAQAARDDRLVVWTNGCFDLIHAGHVHSLQAAASFGDLLVVGLNSDDSVRQLKGAGRPIVNQQERAIVLSAFACVDYVVVFSELTPVESITRLKPDVHCKGADYAPPHGRPAPEFDVVRAYGGRVAYIPLREDLSSTRLLERVERRRARITSPADRPKE